MEADNRGRLFSARGTDVTAAVRAMGALSCRCGDAGGLTGRLRGLPWVGSQHGEVVPVDPWVRAGDADRDRVVAFLQEQVGTGRLSVDEFSERAAVAYASRTFGELDALTGDLLRPMADPPRRARPAAVQVLIVVVLALLLGGAMLALAGMGGLGSMSDMMGHMGHMGHVGPMMGP